MGVKDFLILVVALTVFASKVQAQVAKSFHLRHPAFHLRGDFTMIGNSNMTEDPARDSHYNMPGSNYGLMIYIDADSNKNTINSSSAKLDYYYANGVQKIKHPDSTKIVYAGLYWGGRADDGGQTYTVSVENQNYDKREVKLKGPGASGYTTFKAADTDILFPGSIPYENIYVGYADVTQYVKEHGIGSYTVADIALKEGFGGSVGWVGGWTMVVVYANPDMASRSISLFDGYAFTVSGNNANYNLPVNNLTPPNGGDVNAKIGYFAIEGDSTYDGDYLAIKNLNNNQYQFLKHDGTLSSKSKNKQNFFNSSIYNQNSMTRYPQKKNNYSIDVGIFNLDNSTKNFINNNSTSVNLKYGTKGDTYTIAFFGISITNYTTKGRVVNDINGNSDNEVNASGNHDLPKLYANIFQDNNFIISLSVDSNGQFNTGQNGQNTLGNGSYKVQISSTKGTVSSHQQTLPEGWMFTGESNLGGIPISKEQGNGRCEFTIRDGDVSGLVFGINKLPSANPTSSGDFRATNNSPYDLKGYNMGVNIGDWILPRQSFTGRDDDGIVDTFVITDMPEYINKITINDSTYTFFPDAGIKVPADNSGTHPKFDIEVHIVQSHSFDKNLSLNFRTIDNGRGESGVATAYFHTTQPLPITLSEFAASKHKNNVLLSWKTATEQNNKGFYVLHSIDAKDWNVIKFIPSKAENGTSKSSIDYSMTDKNPTRGVNFYRLRQVDYDEQLFYSEIRKVIINKKPYIIFYPNPVHNVLHIQGSLNQSAKVFIYSIKGSLIKTVKMNSGQETISLKGSPSGIYFISIYADNNQIARFRIVKK